MTLTAKKKLFADAVLRGESNRNAAVEAGYSEATASQAGSRLAKDADVLRYQKLLRAGVAKRPVKKVKLAAPAAVAPEPAQTETVAPAEQPADKKLTAEEFLRELVNDRGEDTRLRLDAAKRLIDFESAKIAPQGKKDGKADAAKQAAGGKFAAGRAPLALVRR